MTTIAILEKQEHLAHLSSIIDSAERIVFLSNNPPESHGETYHKKDDYVSMDDLYEANRRAIQWFKGWAGRPLVDGKSFKEIFTYRGVSLWWFIDFWLFYHEIYRMNIKDIAQSLCIIDAIVKKEKPKRIAFVDDGAVFSRALCAYACAHGIVLDAAKKKSIVRTMRPNVMEWLKYRKFFVRGVMSRLLIGRPGKVDVMLIGLTSQLAMRTDPFTGDERKEDLLLQPVIDELRKRGIPFLNTDVDFTPTSGIPLMLERRGFAVPTEGYIDSRIRRIARREGRRLRSLYKSVKGTIAGMFIYNGVDMWPLLEERFAFAFDNRIPEAIAWLEAYLAMIETHDPKSILVVDENDLPGRAAIVAGRVSKRHVVALQHGTISEFCFDYMHLRGEIPDDLDHHAPHCPVADKTAVYGKNTERLLTEQGKFPPHSLLCTGQPRYDIIRKLRKTLDRDAVYKEFCLDPSRKIILFITQPYKDRFTLARDVFLAMSRACKDDQVVLKPHPRETGHEAYLRIAKEHGLDVKVINKDLFKLLFIADVIVQKDSAAGLEAMLFEKPLICAYLFYEGIAEGNMFLDSGCRIASSIGELEHHLREARSGKNNAHHIAAQNAFIQNEICDANGEATSRVVDLLLG